MIVAEQLRRIPPERRAWLDEQGGDCYESLIDLAVRLPGATSRARVGLRLKSVGSAMRTLAALDGQAEAIILLSPAQDAPTAASLAERARCDWVISDVDEPPALGRVPVRRWEDLERAPVPATRVASEWFLTTSGTTAEPKLVRHSLETLTQNVKLDPQRTEGVRWGMLYDYTRFAGLQVFLQSLLSGATLLVPAVDWRIDAKVDFLARNGCMHLGGTPTLWRTMLMTPGFRALALRQITLGGEIADDRLLTMLRERHPEAGIRHVYGSTEAGVGFSVSDGRAGFPTSYLETPPPGLQLRITNGLLFMRREGMHTAYVSDAGDADDIQDVDGFVDTGDLVEIVGDRVMFLGRASGVVNVGGKKVFPEVVESVLLEHPGVAMARVYARANPITGALVMADIVAAPGFEDQGALSRSVQAHGQARLARHEQPVMVKVVEHIDATAAGKVNRGTS